MVYKYKEVVIEELDFVSFDFDGSQPAMLREVREVYRKAEAFDEIVNELSYQLQNLNSWETLDQKDCQTLKQIIEENIMEVK